ncbi:MAG: hypothetical protein AB8H03_23205 [Saprospiraceae bacterium]
MMRYYLLFLFLLLLLTGCVVPLQTTRVTLIENFTQSFEFEEDIKTKVIDSLLGLNFTTKKNSDEVHDIWVRESIKAKGNAILTFSIVPKGKPDSFYVSGFGAYDIIDTSDGRVYFSARFNMIDTIYYSLKNDLKNNKTIPVYFMQVIINQFLDKEIDSEYNLLTHEKYALEPVKPIRCDVRIKKVANKDIYLIDYEANHKVSLGTNPIGFIKFAAPKHKFDKMIDMRKLKMLVRRNYRKSRKHYNY